MPFTWPQHSVDKMAGLHPDLVKVLQKFAAISQHKCVVAQGVRTREYQYSLWCSSHALDGSDIVGKWLTNCNGTPLGQTSPEGSAGTGLSNHQSGHAVDIMVLNDDGTIHDDASIYSTVDGDMQTVAAAMAVPIIWGGSWLAPKTDSDHWELNRAFYPTA